MDHDRLFKELLSTFFFEFVELFFPKVAASLQRTRLVFLDKEVFTDLASGERHEVDLLVRARFRRQAAFFLIHVENQASAQAEFPRRMFRYFARLHEKHRLPVYPIALFSYDRPRRSEPRRYQVRFPDLAVLKFNFRTIQLNRLDWRKFLKKPNPVASALMTRMNIAPNDRPRVKLQCLRMLATLKLNKAKATLISAFMDSYLKLTAAEHMVYNQQLERIMPKEKEAVLELTNEWIEQGRQEGRQQRGSELVLRLLRRRFGPIPAAFATRIAKMSPGRLDELAEALLDFQSPADVKAWIARKS